MIQPTLDESADEPHLITSNQYRVCAECDQDIEVGDKYGRASQSGDVLCEPCAEDFALMSIPKTPRNPQEDPWASG